MATQERIESQWWHYIEKINSVKGYQYARSIGSLWVNGAYDINTPYSTARAESVMCGGNFIAYTEETRTHVKLVRYDFRIDTNRLNPEIDNWHVKPYLFWKATAVDVHGGVFNVGQGLDVFFPLISERDLWIPKSQVEIFPTGPDYQLRGCDIYNNTAPLLKDGVYMNGFRLETRGVVVPA